MPSSLFQSLPQTQPMNLEGVAQLRQLYSILKSSNNPMMMLQNLAKSNPSVKSALELVQQYNGDPQAAFYALARQKGIDPKQILDILK